MCQYYKLERIGAQQLECKYGVCRDSCEHRIVFLDEHGKRERHDLCVRVEIQVTLGEPFSESFPPLYRSQRAAAVKLTVCLFCTDLEHFIKQLILHTHLSIYVSHKINRALRPVCYDMLLLSNPINCFT